MILDQGKIEDIISNKLEIDFIELILTQQIKDNPIVYKGAGTISQDKNGNLNLKIYHKIKDMAKEMAHSFKHYEAGEIISEDNYFTLEGLDISGNFWFAKNVWVNGTISFPATGKIIKTTLNEIVNIEKNDIPKNIKKQTIIIACPGKYELPCNKREDLPNGGWRLNSSVFKASDIDFELKDNENHLLIIANFESNEINENFYINILEAFNIIFGRLVNPVAVQHYHQDGNILKLKACNKNISNKRIHAPFKHSSPEDVTSFASFVGKYLTAIRKPHSELFGFWYKINRAWQADIENISLTLTVSIEGLSKKFFSQYGAPDDEILSQAEEAKTIIENSKLGQRIRQRLLANLENLKHPSPKSILYGLSTSGLIPKKFADTWIKLRNKSAHAAMIDPDKKTIQKHIDRINICLTLFYILLFMVIKYRGKYIDYSQKGWPDKNFETQC